ncbi:lysozyme-like [Arctopsyche grandis]|uniref:lysozyme-like n=1 Tax=Arctopsyche grandis TaxID=121162 RepID=UPI00406D7EB1
MKRLILCIVLICIIENVSAIRFSKFLMTRELRNRGFPEHELSDWVCLIEAGSDYQTDFVGSRNIDDSFDWGLFQISDRYGCAGYFYGGLNLCDIPCERLVFGDISISVECALKLKNTLGFSVFKSWRDNCQAGNFNLSDTTRCYRNLKKK